MCRSFAHSIKNDQRKAKESRLCGIMRRPGGFCGSLPAAADETLLSDMTTMEIVKDMGLGINLGNTFESCGTWINSSSVKNYETAWGSPVITQDMIQGIADSGFGVLRILWHGLI